MTVAYELLKRVEAAEDELGNALSKYLRENGWEYTCNTPGSHWLWMKKLDDGRVVLVHETTAVSIQKHWDMRKMET